MYEGTTGIEIIGYCSIPARQETKQNTFLWRIFFYIVCYVGRKNEMLCLSVRWIRDKQTSKYMFCGFETITVNSWCLQRPKNGNWSQILNSSLKHNTIGYFSAGKLLCSSKHEYQQTFHTNKKKIKVPRHFISWYSFIVDFILKNKKRKRKKIQILFMKIESFNDLHTNELVL